MTNLPVLAIIAPCYNEQELAQQSCKTLLELLNKLVSDKKVSEKSYISIVDDGSTDNSWNILSNIAKTEKKLKLIKFLFNAGHQKALLAGMTENKADIYVTLDFDLQDDIDVIPEMIEKYMTNNVDIVYGIRNNRDVDSILKKNLTKIYYKMCEYIGIKQIPDCADFRLVSDRVVEFLRGLKENNIYIRGLLYSTGFPYDKVYFSRKLRLAGTPKYSLSKLFELAIDGITTSNIAVRLISIPAVIFLIFSIFLHSKEFFVGSINLFAIVILGEYITKIYTETKNRPNYILADKINYDK